ncbi:hypothetical protein A2362_03130 [Candidatus Curtissbacteria bacterium RIFOXYB1_FULL_41_59]|uniref:Multidrug ABC transporter substrate-binding protein n=1 Tax=Candidatus Curtissbacteria bacterium RIFOXYA1_FULL_41_14 TaxID=1797737 RepID=A0A1F5HEH9_9BACT|nr:MAG: putative ABC transporter [Microgenomates group bacterium GW2011_GWC1_40_35]KKS02007.1 MAG: putative ABC transporter [Candidatus Curtissbacteria bacterium GW2011_GWC2_41_21]OGD92883.1 MAG: hypothetical protein A3E14_01295 [Candidatus Curtissbacteria bacterium RIFCSPHIGHO2_12_FULL_41_13]OGE02518.1 MAG: hypothetical protein A2196_01670 [Candidatus Curtissbacteria bacterium RIFOXYA1_FULL_41_14]OGE05813.1 MAG: hypothetical protein A2362_03130 [Candidatus Curtissbacteria bacterium RIFOXYB1_FU
MNFKESVKIAFVALARNKVRSFLTMLGIIIGVMSVVLLMSLGAGLQESIKVQFEKLGTNTIYVMPGNLEEGFGGGQGFQTNKLKFSDAEDIKDHVKSVKAVAGGVESSVSVTYKGETRKVVSFYGIDPEFTEIGDYKVEKGRTFTKSENSAGKRVAVVGNTIVEELLNNANPLGKEILVKDQKYKIIGVLEEQGSLLGQDQDNSVYIPIESARRQLNFDRPTWILAEVQDPENITQTKSEIEKVLLERLSDDDFSVLTSEETLQVVNVILGIVTSVLAGIAAISLLVGGIGISNIMLVSVTERTREIGLRKAVGARPKDILTQFLIEAIILSVAGGLIGLLLASLGTLALNFFMQATITPVAVILAFGFSGFVGIIFGVIPALRASKLEPIVALRYE